MQTTMSLFVALAFVAIVASLAVAGWAMLTGGGKRHDSSEGSAAAPPNKRMAWALTLRIALSVLLFLAILLAWKLGYLHPTGLQAGA